MHRLSEGNHMPDLDEPRLPIRLLAPRQDVLPLPSLEHRDALVYHCQLAWQCRLPWTPQGVDRSQTLGWLQIQPLHVPTSTPPFHALALSREPSKEDMDKSKGVYAPCPPQAAFSPGVDAG